MNIQEILEYGRRNLIEKKEPYRLAKMLLKHLLQQKENYFIIHYQETVKQEIVKIYQQQVELLKQGMPIQYITHHQEFMGLPFYVDENVLIPQPDTEILAEEVIKECEKYNFKQHHPTISVLDLCTGSGAIGISIANYVSNAQITMTDISEKAIQIAKKNAQANGVEAQCQFVLSDMFQKIEGKFDIIVSNPPYIQTEVIATLEKEVTKEPFIALNGGMDGLKFYRIIAEKAWMYLKKDGLLALEIGFNQKEQVIPILKQTARYKEIIFQKDLAGNYRVVCCRKQ